MNPRRVIAVALVLAVAGAATGGCDWGRRAAVQIGIVDAPPPPPVAVDAICDTSPNSTCTEASLVAVAYRVLAVAATRPGSIVRLWLQGTDASTAGLLFSATSVPPNRTGARAIRDFEEQWARHELACARDAVGQPLSRHVTRSPIAETVSRVALAEVPQGAERYVVILTDGLEVSQFANFECARLPRPSLFVRALHAVQVLAPRSLRGVHVRLCGVRLQPVEGNRCPMTISRALAVRELWQAAFAAAGATDVEITEGEPAFLTSNPAAKETQ